MTLRVMVHSVKFTSPPCAIAVDVLRMDIIVHKQVLWYGRGDGTGKMGEEGNDKSTAGGAGGWGTVYISWLADTTDDQMVRN